MPSYLGHDDKTVSILDDDGNVRRMSRAHLLPDTIERLCGGGSVQHFANGGSPGWDWDNFKKETGLVSSPDKDPTPTTSDQKKKATEDYFNKSYAEGGNVESDFSDQMRKAYQGSSLDQPIVPSQAPSIDMSDYSLRPGGAMIQKPQMVAQNMQPSGSDALAPQPQAPQGLVFPGQPSVPSQATGIVDPSKDPNSQMIRQGFDTEQAGIKQAADSAAKLEAANQARMNVLDQAQQQRDIEHAAKAKDLGVQLQDAKGKVDTAFQDYNSTNIDPNHFWNSKTTGQKVGASLAILLGGIGQGLAGGKNVGLETIENSIRQDIDAQKTALDKKRGAINAAQSLYGTIHGQVNDEATAYNMAMSKGFERAELDLRQMAARSGNSQLQAQAQQAAGELQMKRGMYEKQAAQDYAIKLNLNNFYNNGSGGSKNVNYSLLPDDVKKKIVTVGNTKYLANDDAVAKDTNDKLSKYDFALKTMQDMKEASAHDWLPGVDDTQREALKNKAILAYIDANGMRDTPDNREDIGKMIGDPGAMFQGRGKAKMDVFMQGIQDKKQSILKQSIPNYKPLETGSIGSIRAEKRAQGGAITPQDDGVVPGKAQVKGNSLKNDVVPAMLSPGEMIIPRDIMDAYKKNGPLEILKFIKSQGANGKAK